MNEREEHNNRTNEAETFLFFFLLILDNSFEDRFELKNVFKPSPSKK